MERPGRNHRSSPNPNHYVFLNPHRDTAQVWCFDFCGAYCAISKLAIEATGCTSDWAVRLRFVLILCLKTI